VDDRERHSPVERALALSASPDVRAATANILPAAHGLSLRSCDTARAFLPSANDGKRRLRGHPSCGSPCARDHSSAWLFCRDRGRPVG
jgi:hypothetical protein